MVTTAAAQDKIYDFQFANTSDIVASVDELAQLVAAANRKCDDPDVLYNLKCKLP